MARLYWIITAAVLAVAVHAAYMLLAPARAFGAVCSRWPVKGRNAFSDPARRAGRLLQPMLLGPVRRLRFDVATERWRSPRTTERPVDAHRYSGAGDAMS
jgi:hypothetical protein